MKRATKGYWVLNYPGYPDTQSDFTYAATRADVRPLDLGYLDNPAATVFDGTREPWTESDSYPDWVVSFGPRSGIRWERA